MDAAAEVALTAQSRHTRRAVAIAVQLAEQLTEA
jgi:hypothetical protein